MDSTHQTARKILILQLLGVGVLVLMHFMDGVLPWHFRKWFDLDAESTIPTWYSAMLLFSVAVCSFGIAKRESVPVSTRRFWRLFGWGFGFMSLDEVACIHEALGQASGIKWIYLYAPFAAAFFLMCAWFLIKGSHRTLYPWILGGLLVYALGGLVGESVSYWFRPLPSGWQQVEFVWEEGLEMIGVILVLSGCLRERERLRTQDPFPGEPGGSRSG